MDFEEIGFEEIGFEEIGFDLVWYRRWDSNPQDPKVSGF